MNFKWAASILTILLTVAMGSPASFASDKDDVVGVVNRYLDNLSTEHPEKVQVAVGLCDSSTNFHRMSGKAKLHAQIGGRDTSHITIRAESRPSTACSGRPRPLM